MVGVLVLGGGRKTGRIRMILVGGLVLGEGRKAGIMRILVWGVLVLQWILGASGGVTLPMRVLATGVEELDILQPDACTTCLKRSRTGLWQDLHRTATLIKKGPTLLIISCLPPFTLPTIPLLALLSFRQDGLPLLFLHLQIVYPFFVDGLFVLGGSLC